MWFAASFLAAITYALLWVTARMTRGIPSGVVTAVQSILGVPLLLYIFPRVEYPWGDPYWLWYAFGFSIVLIPLALWALTIAVHTTPVTMAKPLSAISSVVTLVASMFLFGETFSFAGMVGVMIITAGLCVLYHGRWQAWKKVGPWFVIIGSTITGVNAALLAALLQRFPDVIAVSVFGMAAAFVVNSLLAWKEWSQVQWTKRNVIITTCMVIVATAQVFITLYALAIGPAPYVIAVKRSSVLLTAVIGYIFLHERDQSLPQLVSSSLLVILGVTVLAIS